MKPQSRLVTGTPTFPGIPAALALLLLVISGCQSTVIGPDNDRAPETRFSDDFHLGQDCQPRSSPATITHDPEETLVSKGYYVLGEMVVIVNKHDEGRLREIFLREAAARGGDLVRLTVEARKTRDADLIVGQKEVRSIVPTTLSQPFYYTPNGVAFDPQHTQTIFKAGESYMEDVIQKGAVRFSSYGLIWRRYDPQEVRKLPAAERKAIAAWMQHPDGPWTMAPAHFRDIRSGQDKEQIIAWFGAASMQLPVKVGVGVSMWMWMRKYATTDGGKQPQEQPYGTLVVLFDSKGKVTQSSFTLNNRSTINDN